MSETRKRSYEWEDPTPFVNEGLSMSGLDYMKALAEGRFPPPPIAKTLNFGVDTVEEGRVIFIGEADEYHYNPIGVVHGGFAATLLDSALGCVVHTMCPKGTGYTTIQLNVNYTRAITQNTGKLYCEATITHSGRQMSTAEATLKDENGKLYAHATTTCLIFPLKRE